jgi:hypothetical protein
MARRTFLKAAPILRKAEAPVAGAPMQDSANLQLHYILSLQSFGTFGHFEFNAVSFV